MPCVPESDGPVAVVVDGLWETYWHLVHQLDAKRNTQNSMARHIRRLHRRLHMAEGDLEVATRAANVPPPSEDITRAAKIFARNVSEIREEIATASQSHQAMVLEISNLDTHLFALRTAIHNKHF